MTADLDIPRGGSGKGGEGAVEKGEKGVRGQWKRG